MKIRSGFISNSSSSSFILGKAHMTEEQVKKFSKYISGDKWRKCKNEDGPYQDDESELDESDYYFHGSLAYWNSNIEAYLEKIGIDQKYIYND